MVACRLGYPCQVTRNQRLLQGRFVRFQAFSFLILVASTNSHQFLVLGVAPQGKDDVATHLVLEAGGGEGGRVRGAEGGEGGRNSMQATTRFVVCETVLYGDVAEYRRLFSNTFDARRFCKMLSNGRTSTTFDRVGFRRDTAIGTCNRRWARARQWCAGMMVLVCFFIKPFARDTDEATYVGALVWILSGTEGNLDLPERYKLIVWAKAYNKFYPVKDADDWSRKLDFELCRRTGPKGV